MAYIGNIPAEKFTSVDIQNFTVSATANYTLDRPVANENEIELFINNVRQHPGSGKAYTASGTALTLSEATAGTDTMYCVYQGKARQTVTPATSSVTNAMLAGSITQAKLSDEVINEAKLQVSNAPTNGYMLTAQSGNTGGLTWAEAPSGGLVRLGGQSTHTNASNYYIDNVFSNTYTRYKIIGVMMQDNTSETVFGKLRSWDGSSAGNLEAASYCQATTATNIQSSGAGTPTGGYANEWNDTKFTVASNAYNDRSTNQYGIFIDYTLYRPDSTAYMAAPYIVGTSGYWRTSDGFYTQNTAIVYDATVTNLGGIRFFADNGNMSMIDVSVYGIVGS